MYPEWIARYKVPEQISLIVAGSLSRRSSRIVASHSASTRIWRRTAQKRITSASASIVRSSQCYAVPCTSAARTKSHFFLPSCKRTVHRRQSRLASLRLVSCLNAKCEFRSISVPHCLNLHAILTRTRTFFRISRVGVLSRPRSDWYAAQVRRNSL